MRFLPFALIAAVATALSALAQAQDLAPIVGDWYGALNAGVKLPVVLHVKLDGSASVDSPSQGATGMPAAASLTGSAVTLTLTKPAASFEGAVSSDGATLSGQWKQSGAALPLVLTRTAPAVARRPQTPQPPFPYRAEDVTYANPATGLKLEATLTLPDGEGPFPAVLLITGSGTQDRDETILGHKPFLLIADALTRRGVAVLRVDDRGAGGSEAPPATADLACQAEDVRASLAWLRARPQINPARVGLLGHSEGGSLAVITAAADPKVAFVVLMAGPGVSGGRIIVSQTAAALTASGAAPVQVQGISTLEQKLIDIVASDRAAPEALAALNVVFDEAGVPKVPAARAQLQTMVNPHYRDFVRYDPAADLKRIKVPLLAVGGTKDTQVPATENLAAIRAADPRATTRELPGLNHLFQTAGTGLVAEYGEIEETMAPAALALIVDWTLAHATAP